MYFFNKVLYSMTKSALKMYLSAVSMFLISGCTYSSDALFPSLFGSDAQEEMAAGDGGFSDEAVPALGSTNFEPLEISEGGNTGTFVGQKVATFRSELAQLQASIRNNNAQLQQIRGSVINNALQYHKVIGMIEAKLQVGTTPGNPQMFGMLQSAQSNIQTMNANTIALSQLSTRVQSDAANTTYLADSIKAAYGISGAVDEDHRQLRILENEATQTSILINSLLTEINSDISRQQQYIETAKNYIVDLSSAIKAGSYSVDNAPLTPVKNSAVSFSGSKAGISGKPLFVAKFNKSNVKYKDGLKRAVSSAVSKKPGVMFDVVAVSPAKGSQLSAAAAKNNATQIFQDMIEMGVGAEKINLSAKTSGDVTSSEVQIFVK